MKYASAHSIRRGMSLIEVLISVVVFGIFFTLACTTLVRCYSNYVNNSGVQSNFRNAYIGLDKMSRELVHCQQVYAPNPSATWTEYATCTPVASSPFVFAYQQPEITATPAQGTTLSSAPMVAVGYELDNNTQKLYRMVYAQGADPTGTNPVSISVIASPVLSFAVYRCGRGEVDNALCVSVYATVPGKFRSLPVFFSVQVPEIISGQ